MRSRSSSIPRRPPRDRFTSAMVSDAHQHDRAYQRMRGRNVADPMGRDDNGLPAERRVQNVFGILPEPALPYDPDWTPRRAAGRRPPRKCRGSTSSRRGPAHARGRARVRGDLARAGVSSTGRDLDHHRSTRARGVAASFLELYRAGRVYLRPSRRCGTSTSRPRWRKPRSRTGRARAHTSTCASRSRAAARW